MKLEITADLNAKTAKGAFAIIKNALTLKNAIEMVNAFPVGESFSMEDDRNKNKIVIKKLS